MTNRVKVAITGAAGQIGYAFLPRILSGQAFGPNTIVDINLIEVPQAVATCEGLVMELHDCAFPLLGNINVTSDINEGFKDVNFAVLIGAMPRKEGMERSDLLKINGGIFGPQGKAINDNAASDVRVFVVGNPCNTNCLIAMNHAPDVPNDRFYAMTMLDQNRFQSQLAFKAGVSLADVKNPIIWGNHSSTQYPDIYNATIKGKSAAEVIDEKWLQNDLIPLVQQRGAAVIKARGASSAASAANAALDALHALTHDTAAGDSYSMCLASQGEYGVDEGLIYSFPCRTENGKLIVLENFKHNDFSKERLALTLDELRKERDAVKALGLIK